MLTDPITGLYRKGGVMKFITIIIFIFITFTGCNVSKGNANGNEKTEKMKIEKIYKILRSVYDKALIVQDREKAIKIMDQLSYGEACLYYLIENANQGSEDLMSRGLRESMERYPGKDGALRYEHFLKLIDRSESSLRTPNEDACKIFESFSE